jgi:hypothetical protein
VDRKVIRVTCGHTPFLQLGGSLPPHKWALNYHTFHASGDIKRVAWSVLNCTEYCRQIVQFEWHWVSAPHMLGFPLDCDVSIRLNVFVYLSFVCLTAVSVNIKVSCCLFSSASRHEGVLGSGTIVPPLLTFALDGAEWTANFIFSFILFFVVVKYCFRLYLDQASRV